MGEHLPCTQGVKGSNPFTSTKATNLFVAFFDLIKYYLLYKLNKKVLILIIEIIKYIFRNKL